MTLGCYVYVFEFLGVLFIVGFLLVFNCNSINCGFGSHVWVDACVLMFVFSCLYCVFGWWVGLRVTFVRMCLFDVSSDSIDDYG